ncbi:MAG: TlpA disulfide reductase family protein [Planctomycetota bacterium]
MRIQHWCACGLISLMLVGCDNSTSEPVASKENETAPGESATESTTPSASYESISSGPPKDAEMESAGETETVVEEEPLPEGILALPEGTDDQLAKMYKTFAGSEDPDAIARMAQMSGYLGNELAQTNDETAYDFMLQAAELIRKAKASGMEIPEQFIAEFTYNEARAFAFKGETDKATASLQQAVEGGFTDADFIRGDEDLVSLRDNEAFESNLEKWLATAAEKIIQHAKEELANGESFPFEFALQDIDGGDQSVDQYKGKVLIVDVWGTWCPPCRAEIPSFVKLQETYGEDGFQMIGLNYERGGSDEANAKLVKEFAEANGINYPCALGTSEVQQQIPDFGGFPTTLFIDRTGKVRMKAVGLHEYSYLEAIVKTLLEEEA